MQNKEKSAPAFEFSRVLALDTVPRDQVVSRHVAAQAAECLALAERLQVSALESLEADYTLCWNEDESALKAKGRVVAKLVQPCIVTADPVCESVDASFTVYYVHGLPEEEAEADKNSDRDYELITDNQVDLGEMAVQQLALAINPYPRSSPEAALSVDLAQEKGEKTQKPFEKLSALLKS